MARSGECKGGLWGVELPRMIHQYNRYTSHARPIGVLVEGPALPISTYGSPAQPHNIPKDQ